MGCQRGGSWETWFELGHCHPKSSSPPLFFTLKKISSCMALICSVVVAKYVSRYKTNDQLKACRLHVIAGQGQRNSRKRGSRGPVCRKLGQTNGPYRQTTKPQSSAESHSRKQPLSQPCFWFRAQLFTLVPREYLKTAGLSLRIFR